MQCDAKSEDLDIVCDSLPPAACCAADKWVPLLEVPEPALLAWLKAKQGEGYALLGLEQTSESQLLPAFNFPRQAVLVLGKEKEGLPPEVGGRAAGAACDV